MVVDLSRQKKLDADPKETQQTEFVWLSKKLDDDNNAIVAGDNNQSMFVLTFLKAMKETK